MGAGRKVNSALQLDLPLGDSLVSSTAICDASPSRQRKQVRNPPDGKRRVKAVVGWLTEAPVALGQRKSVFSPVHEEKSLAYSQQLESVTFSLSLFLPPSLEGK